MAKKTIKEEQTEVFFIDMELLGFDHAAAMVELCRLQACETEADYIRSSRVGATVKLSRVQRREVFNIYYTWMV